MAKYNVEVIETLSRVVEQEADTYSEAEDLVEEKYRNCEIVLGGDDYADTEYQPFPSQGIKSGFWVSIEYDKENNQLCITDKKGISKTDCKDSCALKVLLQDYFESNVELDEVMPEKEVSKKNKDYER